ncbi:MAG: MFS transporter [Planctomycetota bacterium]|nr:MFS transporter [Planctomycetota bacterium]
MRGDEREMGGANRERGLGPLGVWTLLVCSSLTVMAGAIVSPVLPVLAEIYKAEANAALMTRLVITMPALAIALTGALAGLLADRIGPERVLVASLALYAVAGTTGAYLDDLDALLAGRFGLGLGVAGLMASIGAIIANRYAGEARTKLFGRQSAFMAAGGVVFLPLGGALSQVSHQAPFTVYAASLLMIPLVMASLMARRQPTLRPGAGGDAKLSGGTSRPTNSGDPSSNKPGQRSLAPVVALAIWFQIIFYLGPVQAPFLVKERFAASPMIASVCVAVMTLSAAVVSLNYARLARGRNSPVVAGVTGLAMGIGAVVSGLGGHLAIVIAGQVILGAGAGLIMPNLMGWAARLSTPTTRGRAAGVLTAGIFAGQFLSPIVLQPIVSTRGVGAAFAMAGACSVVGGVVLLMMALRPRVHRAAIG